MNQSKMNDDKNSALLMLVGWLIAAVIGAIFWAMVIALITGKFSSHWTLLWAEFDLGNSSTEGRARRHRNGTGCLNPAQGLLVREQQCSGCTDPSWCRVQPVLSFLHQRWQHQAIKPRVVILGSPSNGHKIPLSVVGLAESTAKSGSSRRVRIGVMQGIFHG